MPYIKRTDGFNASAAGRTLRDCAYRHDDEALLVAAADELRPGDEVIDAGTYSALRSEVAVHNAALPATPADPLPNTVGLLAAAPSDADLALLLPDLATVRRALQALARRL